MTDLREAVARVQGEVVAIRRELHQFPELAFQERRTAGLVAERLREFGLEVREGVGRMGVVGLLAGGGTGPSALRQAQGSGQGRTILVRADMDGLPVVEANDVEYRSRTDGLMHACGHDGHVAALLGLAKVLAQRRDSLAGTVKFVFQPAEERMSGAREMLEDGVLDNPRVDAALGFHLWNAIPVGHVGVRDGSIFASADEIRIVVRGQGGHGAVPHKAVDPIAIAGQVITSLQTLVSREVAPIEPAVMTIGTIRGGSTFNVIADEVEMSGTIRAFSEELRGRLLERAEALVRGVASAMRGEATLEHVDGCPAVVNDPAMTALVRRAAGKVVGPQRVLEAEPSMVGDDMAYFNLEVPACYFLVGSANPEKGLIGPHHSSTFDFDEAALAVAVETLARAVTDYLK